MRTFLPIKGPGGRYLTPREKVALLILGITLVLCILTILHGENAYLKDQSRNPIFGLVSVLCRKFGGGIIALYALVLVWSGLIYFKGEKIARVTPLSGRLFAALAVTVGVSGALGIAHLQTAGGLGTLVGGALGRTFGGGVGFPMLLALMLLGLHLAGQGAWAAMKEPMPLPARAGGGGFGFDAPGSRVSGMTFVDDGDPTSDERTLAVTQAMEEIERRQGVTIIEVDERPSIGEEVAEAPPPPPESEESRVREGLAAVEDLLEVADARPAAPEPEPAPEPEAWAVETEVQEEPPAAEEDYETSEHGLVPVPPAESPAAAWQIAPEEEERVSAGEAETAVEEGVEETVEAAEAEGIPAEAAAAVAEEQEEAPQADGFADEDPYAQGGLLRKI
ncbi:MAG TPA: hypothetical protein VFY93_00610, partial [Planctomycetota bacterium]|nr:hypothetical protein [Planctomycetota bacterium]